MIVGGVLLLALLSLRARVRPFAEILLLLPNLMPPLFVGLAWMNLVRPFAASGLLSVVCMHILLNGGLVAIALDRLVRRQLGGVAETAWVMGARRSRFWWRVAWPLLRSDLACLALFVFSLCFTSFSIPLLVGGGRVASLEMAIYDSIRVDGRWDHAVLFSLMQSGWLLLLAWMLPRGFWPERAARRSLTFLGWQRVKWLPGLPMSLLVIGWCMGMQRGWSQSFDPRVLDQLFPAALASLALGLGVGAVLLVSFMWIAYVSPKRWLDRFLNGYLAPSPTITGFGFLLLPGGGAWGFVKTILALALILMPLLYRWSVHSSLNSLLGQVRTARLLGARGGLILSRVVWPQAGPAMLKACGLGALWASGDFALSGLILGNSETWPLVMQDLIGGYRLEQAQWLMWPLALMGLSLYGLFLAVSRYVTR